MNANPFLAARERELARTAPPAPVEDDEDLDERVSADLSETEGPQKPLNEDSDSSVLPELPIGAAIPDNARMALTGVHGGAGVSTMLTLMDRPEIVNGARTWPIASPWIDENTSGVVLVARTHRAGLDRLQAALTAWHGGAYADGVRLLGVCLVDDGPRLSKSQAAQVKRCMSIAPHGWRIPWVESFRVDPADELVASGPTKRTLRSIRKTAEKLGSRKETA